MLARPARLWAREPAPLPRRLPSLTALRYPAALGVLLLHVSGPLVRLRLMSTIASSGYLGVSFFFMLSGFVLTWAERPGSVRGFWRRRFARVWPLQFVMLVVLLWAVAPPQPISTTLADISLLQAWAPAKAISESGNGVSWSLSCEAFFYLMFPLAIGPILRLRRRGLAIVAATTAVLMVVLPLAASALALPDWLTSWAFFTMPGYRFGEFLLGMVAARLVALGLRIPGWMASLSVIELMAATAHLWFTRSDISRPLLAWLLLPGFGLTLAWGATRDIRGAHCPTLLLRLGEWSFALYLLHQGFFRLMRGRGWLFPSSLVAGTIELVGFIALATAVAALLHHLIERPAQRLVLRLLRSRPSEAVAPVLSTAATTH